MNFSEMNTMSCGIAAENTYVVSHTHARTRTHYRWCAGVRVRVCVRV